MLWIEILLGVDLGLWRWVIDIAGVVFFGSWILASEDNGWRKIMALSAASIVLGVAGVLFFAAMGML